MSPRCAPETFRPRAVLLDFYGTVVQEDDVPIGQICGEISKASALAATPAEIGSCWAREFRRLCAQSFGAAFRSQKELERVSLERVLQHFRAERDADALSQVLYEYWARPAIFPESRSVLAQCGIPICLVSNIDNAELRSALRQNDLSFDRIVTSEDCRAYKPRGEVFEKALSLLGASAQEVLHVGDSLGSDVCGAKAVGIRALWINRNSRPAASAGEAPDYVSTDLNGLLEILGSGE